MLKKIRKCSRKVGVRNLESFDIGNAACISKIGCRHVNPLFIKLLALISSAKAITRYRNTLQEVKNEKSLVKGMRY